MKKYIIYKNKYYIFYNNKGFRKIENKFNKIISIL